MPWLEKRGGRYRIKFRYGGKNYQYALKTEQRGEAEAMLGRLEGNLILLERGRLDPPADGDLSLFLLSDGKLNRKPKVEESVSLAELFRRYKAGFTEGAKESSTRYTEKIHMAHLERLMGARTGIRSITTETLQAYADERAKETGRNDQPVSHATIQKELGTLASIWNRFAVPQGLVTGPAPTKGVVYRKAKAKPPFQTWEQVERRIKRGGMSELEQQEEWDSLFLSIEQVQELLDYVRDNAWMAFVYPMFVFAAHTGARRSEMVRSQIDDFDFAAGMVRLREKKKDRSKEFTFRHVPISPLLGRVMKDWFGKHPGGQLTLCERPGEPITAQMATHYFTRTLGGSKWEHLRGWHTLRHSFVSNCAARGVDQRTIDSWSGHQTDEMRARYTHLFPDQQKKSMGLVFGE